MKLVFATRNQNKFKEVQQLMPNHIQLINLDDIGCTEEILETGKTLEDNSFIKSSYVFQHYNFDCFADDTGLEIDALGGAPGVYSARYASDQKNDQNNIRKILQELEGITNRMAHFKTVISLQIGNTQHFFTGVIKGHIFESPKGRKGFGYDAVFRPLDNDKTFAEMALKEKNSISHRRLAIEKLVRFLSRK